MKQPRERDLHRSAEARWRLSRDSRPPRRDGALLHLLNKHHDLLFDISHGFSAKTPALQLRRLSEQSAPREASTPATPLQTHFNLHPNSVRKRPCRHSKPITPRVQTAHFKSLYRKRSGLRISACSRSSRLPERFRYSPRTWTFSPNQLVIPDGVALCRAARDAKAVRRH
jgi:hypothetical protein